MKTSVITYPYMDKSGTVTYRIGNDMEFVQFFDTAEQRLDILNGLETKIVKKGMQLVHTHRTIKDGVGMSVNFYCEE